MDELPTPYGLVRYGVAPDHPQTKNVINDFEQSVFADERVHFIGNVSFGKDINANELLNIYDCIVLSYGANDNQLFNDERDTPLSGVISARTFVNWYNGHPHFVNSIQPIDIQTESVVIIGQGNVAIDCARILTQSASEDSKLSSTDIAKHALQMLRYESKIKEVFVVGRRGAVQSSFTNKELREVISQIPECVSTVMQSEYDQSMNNTSVIEMEERAIKRKMNIFEYALNNELLTKYQKSLHFRFLLSPKKFNSDTKRVTSVTFERNELQGNVFEQKAIGIGHTIDIECGLVLLSIGYQSQLMDQSLIQSWDDIHHCFKHSNGQLLNHERIFVAGWLKRGPNGIIGTNIPDAQETVNSILCLQTECNHVSSVHELMKICNDKKLKIVDKQGWYKICAYERAQNEKMINIQSMIEVANS